MPQSFDIRELVRVAVIDERSGGRMYDLLTEQAEDPGLKKRFERLAKAERVHERRFEQMLEGLAEPEASFNRPDEYVQYLETLVAEGKSREGSDRAESVGDCRSDHERIDLAMEFERRQLVLMQEMAELLGADQTHVADEILSEERAHLVDLSAAKADLGGS
jgi:rubrerythrin